jgi:hypothetical protein
MTVKWQRENAEGTLWSATVLDSQQGWFEQWTTPWGHPPASAAFAVPIMKVLAIGRLTAMGTPTAIGPILPLKCTTPPRSGPCVRALESPEK